MSLMNDAALSGIRVFDLTIAMAGPWTTKLLGELGAEVIKVEEPQGEMLTLSVPTQCGVSVGYADANLNKRVVGFDLKDPQHREAALRLADTCDVFVTNLRPGVPERLGFGYEDLAGRNPKIVYARLTGWGPTGPMVDDAAVDPLLQAFAGPASLTGARGGPPEFNRHTSHVDITAAAMATEGILLALYARERTGVGQRVDISMLHATIASEAVELLDYELTGQVPGPAGSRSGDAAPDEAFRTADGTWLAVTAEDQASWHRLCGALECVGLADDARFTDNRQRLRHRDELAALLAARFARESARALSFRLSRAAVTHATVTALDSWRYHGQARANEWVVDLPMGEESVMCVEGRPWRFADNPLPPVENRIGADFANGEVLAELGLGDHPAIAVHRGRRGPSRRAAEMGQ
jgi:crotonobetainyl-CoA:carnitine CoA-transferase CaiB-like acyl-CoA transferase